MKYYTLTGKDKNVLFDLFSQRINYKYHVKFIFYKLHSADLNI